MLSAIDPKVGSSTSECGNQKGTKMALVNNTWVRCYLSLPMWPMMTSQFGCLAAGPRLSIVTLICLAVNPTHW